jgi:hypothetical protein
MHRVAVAAVLFALGLSSVLACARVERALRMPTTAGRKAPPPGIDGARGVGAAAGELRLASTAGELSLAHSLESGPAVLVFYRGDW